MTPFSRWRGRRLWLQRTAVVLTVAVLVLVGNDGLAGLPGTARWAGASVEASPNLQTDVLQGYAPGFFRAGQSPDTGTCPSVAQIQEDLRHIFEGQLANAVRGYGQDCNQDQIPALAASVAPGLSVYPAVYCYPPDLSKVPADIDTMTNVTAAQLNVKANMVCNEPSQLDLAPSKVVEFLQQARSKQRRSVPLTTADIALDSHGRGWLDPEYIKTIGLAVDIVVAHVHPFWDNVCVDQAADLVMTRLNQLKAAYPMKQVVLGEAAWPSAGDPRATGCAPGNAAPSIPNQERFLRDLLPKLQAANQSAFYFEAYDEPWKAHEGGTNVGDHWGTHYVDGTCKHQVPSVMFSQLRPPGTPPPLAACQPRVVALSPSLPGELAAVEDGAPAAGFALLQAQAARENGLAPRSGSAESAAAASAAWPIAAPLAEQETPPDATARAEEPEPGGTPAEAGVQLDQPGPPAPPTSTPAPLAAPEPVSPPTATSTPAPLAAPEPVSPPTATSTERSVAGQSEAGGGLVAPALPAQPPAPFLTGPFAAPPPLLPPFPPLLPPLPASAPVVIITGAAAAVPASPTATVTPSATPTTTRTATATRTPTPTATRTPVSAGLAFVANAGSANVSVFTVLSGQFLVDLPLPGGAVLPLDLAINRDGTRLFTVNQDNVSAFDLTSNRALGNIPLPSGASDPIDLVLHPDGSRVYVANTGSRNVSVLDAITLQPLRNIPLPAGADGSSSIAIHPNGTRVYVSNARSANVSVLDPSTNQPLVNVPLGSGTEFPVCIAVNPAGTRVYTANLVTRSVSVLDAGTNQLLATIPLPAGADGPVHVVVSPDGTRLYTANNGTSNVSVLDATTNRALFNIALPPGATFPLALGLNPDGTRLYTVNDSNIAVLDTVANRPLGLITLHDDLNPAAIVVR